MQERTITKPILEPTTQIDIINKIPQVNSRIKDEITADFTLCKLSNQDKEAVTEIVSDAYYCKEIIKKYKNKKKWNWDDNKKEWHETGLTTQEIKKIDEYLETVFDTFMKRIFMVAILNRNVKDNYIIEYMTNYKPEGTETEEQQQTIIQKIKDKIKNPKKQNEEEE